jgi:hypothetical protein
VNRRSEVKSALSSLQIERRDAQADCLPAQGSSGAGRRMRPGVRLAAGGGPGCPGDEMAPRADSRTRKSVTRHLQGAPTRRGSCRRVPRRMLRACHPKPLQMPCTDSFVPKGDRRHTLRTPPIERKATQVIRNLKALGLAVLAVCAMGAFSAASASAAEFHSSTEHTILVGAELGMDVTDVQGGEISCSNVNYEGTTSARTTSTVNVSPSYSGCIMFGLFGGTVYTNGCQYTIHTVPSNTFDIVCPSGKAIEFLGAGCKVTFGPQTGLTSVTFTTVGKSPKRHIVAKLSLTGLIYTQHNNGGFCVSGSYTDGKYTGEATMIGTDTNGAQSDVWYA